MLCCEAAENGSVLAEGAGLVASQTGAVTFVHHFGGSLNLHVHLHVIAVDGVFTRQLGERAIFHAVASPTPEELAVVTNNVARRMTRWLARAGYVREVDDETEPELDGIARCCQLSLAGGTFLRLDADEAMSEVDEFSSRKRGPLSAPAHGFSLHVAVFIAASDRAGRERLLRYGARPSLSLERLSQLPNGRIAYALKRPGRRGATHRVMEPLELMARLATLVPPPWHPLTRFHGVLAPHHGWRSAVVPGKKASGALPGDAAGEPAGQLALSLEGESKPEATVTKAARHASTYLPWAELLARTFALAALRCPACSGKLRVVKVVTDSRKACWWLARQGLQGEVLAKRATTKRARPVGQLRLAFDLLR